MSDPPCNGLSIDVEEYFHALNLRPAFPRAAWPGLPRRAEAGVERCLEILDRAGRKATFFVLGWIAEFEPQIVRTIQKEGHEIGSHGDSHDPAHELGQGGFEKDVRRSLELLARLDIRPRGFRASTFSVTRSTFWALQTLADLGIDYDSSIFPVRHDRYGISDFSRVPTLVMLNGRSLAELPLLTLRRLGINLPAAGGGYLRQFPLSLTRRALKEMNEEGHPGVLYVHPWELDPEQPRAPSGTIGWLSAVRHYRNLDQTADRLRRLLDEFEFGPLQPIADRARASHGQSQT